MTRDQHLEFCRRCLNRSFDPNHGIVCSLTGQIAAFENNCTDFRNDESVTLKPDEEIAYTPDETKTMLSNQIFEELRLEQNLLGAVAAGIITAVICAVIWAAITVTLKVQVGYMALLVGIGVGYVIRTTGRGIDPIFRFSGAIISLFGCMLGNFFSVIAFIAIELNLGYLETLFSFDYSMVPDIMIETLDFHSLIFYVLALVTGYRLAVRTLTEKDIKMYRNRKYAR